MKKLKDKKKEEKEMKEESMRRFYNRNIEAMTFCNDNGVTIYPAAQTHNSNLLRLFVHKGVIFKPLNDIEYDQSKHQDVIEYVAAIDKRYEALYLKMKSKV